MEISPFPFLNQEEISHLHSLFQDIDSNTLATNSNAHLKRRRKDGEEDESGWKKIKSSKNNPVMSDILSSLLLLDEEEKQEYQQWAIESQLDKAALDWNHKQKVVAMNDYRSDLEAHFSDLDEMDHTRTKRARRAASEVATAAAVTETALASSESGGPGGGGSGQQQQHRRLWVKDRSKDWWDKCNHPDFPDEEFRKAFRMSKATFDLICMELDSAVTKKNTMLRDAIPVRQRIAVCIWRLATGEPLRLVSKRFGLGISTCHKLVLEVCSAIKNVLMQKFVQWPDEEKMKMIKGEFESISGVPNVGGSVYTTHVPIIAPKVNVSAYYNRRHTERHQKTSYSMTVQGVVDPRGVFTDVCIGYPGSMPDDKVLEESALFKRASRGDLKNVWLVGNSGLPLMDWVLATEQKQTSLVLIKFCNGDDEWLGLYDGPALLACSCVCIAAVLMLFNCWDLEIIQAGAICLVGVEDDRNENMPNRLLPILFFSFPRWFRRGDNAQFQKCNLTVPVALST
ncbi:hypothetical protein D5086_011641 [Populus alba]|uniref:Uncharacterized protein n=1 Tax=Populus alba TaxID=43335 RepID=A0ACC4CEK0_POPAL